MGRILIWIALHYDNSTLRNNNFQLKCAFFKLHLFIVDIIVLIQEKIMKKLILIILVCVLSSPLQSQIWEKIMKKFILFNILLLFTFSLSASVWQRVEGVNSKVQTELLIDYNNKLYIQSSTPKQKIFSNSINEWKVEPESFFSTIGKIITYNYSNNIAFVSTTNGNYRTFDSGETWELVDSVTMYNIAFSESTIFGQGQFTEDKLFKLEPNSKTWEPVTFLNNENKIDTVIGDQLEAKNNILLAADGAYLNKKEGVYISINSGKNWYKSKTFNGKAVSLVIHNDILFVGASDKHIYKSIDYGETWLVDTSKNMPVDKFISTDLELVASVNKIADLYEGESGIHISKDNGNTWEKIDAGFEGKTIKQFEEVNGEIFALDNDKGVYKYSINSKSWSQEEILYDSLICSDIIIYKDTLYTTGKQRGILYSSNNGTSWDVFNLGLDSISLTASKMLRNENLFVLFVYGLNYNYFLSSTDGGRKWLSNVIPNSKLTDILLLDDKLIATTENGVKYSTDNGSTFKDLTGGELDSGMQSGRVFIDEDKNIYIPTTKGLLQSTDNGKDWNIFITKENMLNSNIWYTIVKNNVKVYGFNEEGDLFITENQGSDWQLIGDEISEYYAPNDVLEIDNSLVVVVGGGVVVSNDRGVTWNSLLIESKHEDGSHYALRKVVEKNGYLIAATDYGIWKAKLSDIGIVKSSVESEIIPNSYYPYPQPAHSEVTIEFGNYNLVGKNISIYNVEGKELRNQIIRINNNSIIWDCSSALPGIYLINIKHGSDEKSVKVVVE